MPWGALGGHWGRWRSEEWASRGDRDSGSGSAPLGRIRNPAATDAAELRRNPAVTQRHGPKVTLSVTQITDVKPARRRGWPGAGSPQKVIWPP